MYELTTPHPFSLLYGFNKYGHEKNFYILPVLPLNLRIHLINQECVE